MKEVATSHCGVAEMMARRLGFPDNVQRAVRYTLEQWDGKGPAKGLKGVEIPISSRIVHLAQVTEVAYSFGGPPWPSPWPRSDGVRTSIRSS